MMDQKALITNVVTAAVTAVVLGVGAGLMGVFEKGAVAISEDQIEAVIKRVLVTDAGVTHAAALNTVNGTLIQINTQIIGLQGDVNDLEDAVLDLAGE